VVRRRQLRPQAQPVDRTAGAAAALAADARAAAVVDVRAAAREGKAGSNKRSSPSRTRMTTTQRSSLPVSSVAAAVD